jgi:hypothetical protein
VQVLDLGDNRIEEIPDWIMEAVALRDRGGVEDGDKDGEIINEIGDMIGEFADDRSLSAWPFPF